MAPEQIGGRRGDARTDVYAVGTMLYEMLTKNLPFQSANANALLRAKANEDPKPPSYFVPKLDPALEAIILQGDPARRRAIATRTPPRCWPSCAIRRRRCAARPTPPARRGAAWRARVRRLGKVALVVGVIGGPGRAHLLQQPPRRAAVRRAVGHADEPGRSP